MALNRTFARELTRLLLFRKTQKGTLSSFFISRLIKSALFISAPRCPLETTQCSLNKDAEYLLYVGYRNGYKNFKRFIKAFASSDLLKNRFALVAFGGGPFSNEEKESFSELEIGTQIRHLDGTDLHLAHCYAHATALIYPSLYEGFGLPILEAMTANCPVICSHHGSLTEVAGEAAAYFDGSSIEDIKHAMEKNSGRSPTARRASPARGGTM